MYIFKNEQLSYDFTIPRNRLYVFDVLAVCPLDLLQWLYMFTRWRWMLTGYQISLDENFRN